MQQQHDDVGNHPRHLLDYFPHQCATETVHWNAYEHHLRLHPDEASDADDAFGLTALHYVVCVSNPPAPLRVVQRTYESYPDALLATTTERNNVVEREEGDDEEHAVSYNSNNTVLHMAIRENPNITSDVVQFLIDQQPSAASTFDAAGYLPLHYVKSADVARVLIDAYPKALETRRRSFFDNNHADNNNFDDDVGETPLECALHENGSGPVPSEVVQTLIEEGYTRAETLFGGNCRRHGGGVLVKPKGKGGVSPLEHVCALTSRWGRSAEEKELSSSESDGGGSSSSSSSSSAPVSASVPSHPCHGHEDDGKEEDDDNIKLWNNLTHVVQAAYSARKGYSTVASTVPALHCMIALRLPIDLLTNVLSYQPHQIQMKDGLRGRLPLHVACETPRTPVNVLKLLLTLNSKGASQADGTGRLPLHLAVECGMSYNEGIRLLVETEKRAVCTMDVTRQGMYPFMMAAMGKKKKKKRQGCLDSVYVLLREVPYLIS